jgi:DNA-binding response OmpR family regulator
MIEGMQNNTANAILVIEDDHDQLTLWKMILMRHYKQVYLAATVAEAIAAYQSHHEEIGAVLADVNLGGHATFGDVLVGWETVAGPLPPIALLTARPRTSPDVIRIFDWVASHASAAGPTPLRYFGKPTTMNTILDCLKEWVSPTV